MFPSQIRGYPHALARGPISASPSAAASGKSSSCYQVGSDLLSCLSCFCGHLGLHRATHIVQDHLPILRSTD